MATNALDARMARLEGASEQIISRLGAIETRLESLESRMDARFTTLEGRIETRFATIEGKFTWVIGLLLTGWITLMLAILLRR